jgi:hypothetical protein
MTRSHETFVSQPKRLFRSSIALTDTLHMVSIAGPLFLILMGSYVIYEKLIADFVTRMAVLVAILGIVAAIAPMGSRLKQVEITESGFQVFSSHVPTYGIAFTEIERFSTISILGVVMLRLSASDTLPNDSIWIILEVPAGKTRREGLEEVRVLLQQRIGVGNA